MAAAELGLAFNLTTESKKVDSSKLKVVSDAPTSRPEEEGDPDHVETDDVRPDISGLPLFRPEEKQGEDNLSASTPLLRGEPGMSTALLCRPDGIERVQHALRDQGLVGWLLYEFHGVNPIAVQLLGMGKTTRRGFVLIPAKDNPVALIHAIEASSWRHWPPRNSPQRWHGDSPAPPHADSL